MCVSIAGEGRNQRSTGEEEEGSNQKERMLVTEAGSGVEVVVDRVVDAMRKAEGKGLRRGQKSGSGATELKAKIRVCVVRTRLSASICVAIIVKTRVRIEIYCNCCYGCSQRVEIADDVVRSGLALIWSP